METLHGFPSAFGGPPPPRVAAQISAPAPISATTRVTATTISRLEARRWGMGTPTIACHDRLSAAARPMEADRFTEALELALGERIEAEGVTRAGPHRIGND